MPLPLHQSPRLLASWCNSIASRVRSISQYPITAPGWAGSQRRQRATGTSSQPGTPLSGWNTLVQGNDSLTEEMLVLPHLPHALGFTIPPHNFPFLSTTAGGHPGKYMTIHSTTPTCYPPDLTLPVSNPACPLLQAPKAVA